MTGGDRQAGDGDINPSECQRHVLMQKTQMIIVCARHPRQI